MPHESILLINCHPSFLLYCSGKQIKSEPVVVNRYPGWAVSTGCFLPPGGSGRLPGTGMGAGRRGERGQGEACKGAREMPALFGVLGGSWATCPCSR